MVLGLKLAGFVGHRLVDGQVTFQDHRLDDQDQRRDGQRQRQHDPFGVVRLRGLERRGAGPVQGHALAIARMVTRKLKGRGGGIAGDGWIVLERGAILIIEGHIQRDEVILRGEEIAKDFVHIDHRKGDAQKRRIRIAGAVRSGAGAENRFDQQGMAVFTVERRGCRKRLAACIGGKGRGQKI